MKVVFWAGLIVIFYTYAGYPILLAILVKVKSLFSPRTPVRFDDDELPTVTLLIACYNEADILERKILNTLQLDYPVNKRRFLFVTDGSNDASMDIVRRFPEVELQHSTERRGKNAAVNRVMPDVSSPIVIFCDANTFLNRDALKLLVRHFKDPKVGAVAGEKRVDAGTKANAAGGGEGAYWKYESLLKKWDSELHTVVGAAGELFAIRTSLYEEVPPNVLIEDFRLSMNIAKNGYRVLYEPLAVATETGSASVEEERKRKVRISAGGLIEVWHFMPLLNFFKYGWLSLQYVSHRMLRWTIAPACLPIVFIANALLLKEHLAFYNWMFIAQCGFYVAVAIGAVMKEKKVGSGLIFIPYYFFFMNMSLYQGVARLIKGKQTAVWEKSKRAA